MHGEPMPCPLCQEANPDAFRIWYDGAVKLYRCRSCGFIAQFPGPGRNTIVEDYTDCYTLDYRREREFLRQERAGVFADIARRLAARSRPGARLLDIGCGDGQFLSLCRQAGFDCHGVEPSPALASYGREKTGADIIQGYYGRDLYAEGSFDCITLIQVLEHLTDPVAALEAVHYHLREGGLVAIEVPSINSPRFLAYRCTGIKRFVRPPHGVIPLHFGYYSPATLSDLTRRCGFDRLELQAGRRRVMRSGRPGAIDALLNALQIGGLLYIGRKQGESAPSSHRLARR